MDDIAKELGVSKKTLYQVVENKADLIKQTVQSFIDIEKQLVALILGQADDAVHEMVILSRHITQKLRDIPEGLTIDLMKYYPRCWDLMEAYRHSFIYKVIKDNIIRGMKQEVYRSDVNPDIIAKLYVGKTSLIVDEAIFPLRNYKKEILFNEYINYHLHGIASAKGLKLLAKHTKTKQ